MLGEGTLSSQFAGGASKVTAIVTAFSRIDRTLETLRVLQRCDPLPDEILVHIDGNHTEMRSAVRDAFPGLDVILSEGRIGPGGGRNKLIYAARNEFVASFDDDSFPLDEDYFARVRTLFDAYPDASILCGTIYHRDEVVDVADATPSWVADFTGGACVYRRNMFVRTRGYVPLAVAYGMEEVDLALQCRSIGGRILQTGYLRVRHDTDRRHHAEPVITAASVANIILLVYLRYPLMRWCVGAAQLANRILYLIRSKRWRGILKGLLQAPRLLLLYSGYRKRVSASTLDSYLYLRRHPIPAHAIASNEVSAVQQRF
jgi:GT2 family glycosyltransferase